MTNNKNNHDSQQPSNTRKFTMKYEEEDDGGYSGQCLELPGAISQGETLNELMENMKDAINLILESIKEETEITKKKLITIEI